MRRDQKSKIKQSFQAAARSTKKAGAAITNLTKQSETQIQRAILQYLRAKRFFVVRLNNTGVWDPAGSFFRKSPNVTPGVSDLVMVHRGLSYWIEIKTPAGRQSPDQKVFQANVERAGGKYVVLRSLDEAVARF